MSDSANDVLLVTITKSKTGFSVKRLVDGLEISKSSLDELGSCSTGSGHSFVVATDDRGQKDYDWIKLTKPRFGQKKLEETESGSLSLLFKEDDIGEKTRHVTSKDSTPQKEDDKKRRIIFSERECIPVTPVGSLYIPTQQHKEKYYLKQEQQRLMRETTLARRIHRAKIRSKIEIVTSIIDEIIFTLGDVNKEYGKTPVHLKHTSISSGVKRLELPVRDFKSKPFLNIEPNIKKVLLDSDLPTDKVSHMEEKKLIKKEVEESESDTRTSVKYERGISFDSPFELSWCFGFNPDIPVVNLSSNERSYIMFAHAQFPVLYNFHDNTMKFMQGHHNTVSCLATDLLGSLLVSADCGPNSRVIIWNFRLCVIDVLSEVHPRGIQLLGISNYGSYLITVSPPPQQCVQLWQWNKNKKHPAGKKYFSEILGEIKKLIINPYCAEEFALVFETGVTFVYFNKDAEDKLNFDTHQFPKKLGKCTDVTFLSDKDTVALSSTSKGYVLVWSEEVPHKKINKKHIRLNSQLITHIEAVDNLVAIATVNGDISFFDTSLSILYWTSKLQLGQLGSLSFNLWPHTKDIKSCHESHSNCALSWRREEKQLVDATLQPRPLFVRHFVISTSSGRIAYINSTNDVPKYILYPSNAIYTAMDIIPRSHYLCVGTSLGQCVLFDINDHKIKVTQQLKVPDNMCQAVSYLCYSRSGLQLACGMHTGTLWLLDPLLLTPRPHMPLTHCSNCISNIVFSPDSKYLAVADTNICVTVYSTKGTPVLIGQYQVHSRPIIDVFFVVRGSQIKLFTLGMDRNVTELEIVNNNLEYKQIHRMEQSAVPTCIVPHPSCKEHFLMVNSECIPSTTQRYLVFGTSHHIGLHILPIDGNPYKALAYKASSTPIVSCKIHPNGNYIFTISENCSAVHKWKINTSALEDFFLSGGEGLDPFLSLLEGGRGGWKERDLQEFFLTGQFIHQGEKPSITRTLTNNLHVCEVVNIFQALGFFPTKYQIKNLQYELEGAENCNFQLQNYKQIGFEDFVQLYINHQPSFELTNTDLYRAFCDFYNGVYMTDNDSNIFQLEMEPVFDSVSFAEKLMDTGEEMSFLELYTDLSILTGDKTEMVNKDVMLTLPFMPKDLTFETFVLDLLGFHCEYSDKKRSTTPSTI